MDESNVHKDGKDGGPQEHNGWMFFFCYQTTDGCFRAGAASPPFTRRAHHGVQTGVCRRGHGRFCRHGRFYQDIPVESGVLAPSCVPTND